MCPPIPPGSPRTESWRKRLHSYFQAESPIKYYVAKIRLFSSKKIQAQGRIYEKMLTFQQVDYIIEKPTKSKRFAAIPVAKQI